MSKDQLDKLVANLPELYQPIYGHSELSRDVSRGCEDRLEYIRDIYKALADYHGRPLRVLDLGCAQGFFSFHLAEMGAEVHGVDFCLENVNVCKKIACEHPEFKAHFTHGKLEDVLEDLAPEQFDLVLGLSVFHHIVYTQGLVYVQNLTKKIADNIPAAIFEFALDNEPLYWAKSLPSNPKELLSGGFAFSHTLAFHNTHLSEIERPLIFASNNFWYLDGRLEKFKSWTFSSHNLAPDIHQKKRRYFMGEALFAKTFDLKLIKSDGDLHEVLNELEFYKRGLKIGRSPDYISSGVTDEEAWIVTRKLKGKLLLDHIQQKEPYDHAFIIENVLKQLVELEKQGLYHNDVRTWNIMMLADGYPQLIDFGAVSKNPKDCVWPEDLFFSFFIFIHDVVSGAIPQIYPTRSLRLSPLRLPEAYRDWAYALWQLPRSSWSFELMLKLLQDTPKNTLTAAEENALNVWCDSVEEAVSMLNRELVDKDTRIIEQRDSLEKNAQELAQKEEIIRELNAQLSEKAEKLDEKDETIKIQDDRMELDTVLLAEKENIIKDVKTRLAVLQKELNISLDRHAELFAEKDAIINVQNARLERYSEQFAETEAIINLQNERIARYAEQFAEKEAIINAQNANLKSLQTNLNVAVEKQSELAAQNEEMVRGLHSLYNSRSWKVTGPFRTFKTALKFAWSRISLLIKRYPLAWLSKTAILVWRVIQKFPLFKNLIIKILERMPSLLGLLQSVYIRERFRQQQQKSSIVVMELESTVEDSHEPLSMDVLTQPDSLEAKVATRMRYHKQLLNYPRTRPAGLRIVLDMQGIQTASGHRGIGRYSLNLAKAMLRNGKDHEFFLFLNGSFSDSIERIKAEFSGLVPEDHFVIWHNLPEQAYNEVDLYARADISRRLREHFIQMLQPDFIHISSLFESPLTTLSVNAFHDNIPTAITFYDLIPLIYQDKYLGAAAAREIYMGQIEELKKADLLLAISTSARQEGIDLLNFPEEKIISISSDASDAFKVVSMTKAEADALRARFGIKGKFMMTIGSNAMDLRKNIKKLVEAFALLPKSVQKEYQLLLVGQDSSINGESISKIAKNLGINSDAILLPGRVPDEELILLCNITDLFVFPSLHEGFGLPLLEAMRCGAPVIGSNNSSIPEVIGLEEALFDAESKEDIAAKIEAALKPGKFRTKLIEHCAEHHRKFSWDNSAVMALREFENIAAKRKETAIAAEVA